MRKAFRVRYRAEVDELLTKLYSEDFSRYKHNWNSESFIKRSLQEGLPTTYPKSYYKDVYNRLKDPVIFVDVQRIKRTFDIVEAKEAEDMYASVSHIGSQGYDELFKYVRKTNAQFRDSNFFWDEPRVRAVREDMNRMDIVMSNPRQSSKSQIGYYTYVCDETIKIQQEGKGIKITTTNIGDILDSSKNHPMRKSLKDIAVDNYLSEKKTTQLAELFDKAETKLIEEQKALEVIAKAVNRLEYPYHLSIKEIKEHEETLKAYVK